MLSAYKKSVSRISSCVRYQGRFRFEGIFAHWPFFLLLVVLTSLALWGVERIPFHPDESTQLFMSFDFELWFSNPQAMAWEPARSGDLRQHYRLLDAPLPRYFLGLGRSIARLPALPADWDWSKTWESNLQAGALPGQELLTAGRRMISILLLLTLLFLYDLAVKTLGKPAALLAVLFFGLNSLVLLHGRRAMAEGPLLFGITFSLWAFANQSKRPWLAGLAVALAFNAKQTSLALLPVGLIVILWVGNGGDLSWRKRAVNVLVYLSTFALVTVFLNPFLWKFPIAAAQAAVTARSDLLNRQLTDFRAALPGQVTATYPERLAVLAVNLFLGPPSFAEVGNYLSATAAAEDFYRRMAIYNLGRSFLTGSILFFLTLVGIGTALARLRSARRETRRNVGLLILATLAQTAGLILFVPFTWQRYVMPLVPLLCVWAGSGLAYLAHPIFTRTTTVVNSKLINRQ